MVRAQQAVHGGSAPTHHAVYVHTFGLLFVPLYMHASDIHVTVHVHVKESPKHTRATSSKGNMIVLSPTPILVMNISIYINKRNTSVK